MFSINEVMSYLGNYNHNCFHYKETRKPGYCGQIGMSDHPNDTQCPLCYTCIDFGASIQAWHFVISPNFCMFFFLQFLILNHTVRNKSVNCSVKMTELGANELSHDERGMYEQHK
jgi:hypothetical protein